MTTTPDAGTYVIAARYEVLPGELPHVLATLREAARATRAEPGCLEFRVHEGADQPDRVLLYEEYASAADFEAHCATEHFTTLILGEVVPRLASRERTAFHRVV